ncbi:MAG: DUF58 domain-containing protein [Gammaproteobacteria bacterium]|nr:DUF58 domain-containing protein [Gammaproteobacteria bacterium]
MQDAAGEAIPGRGRTWIGLPELLALRHTPFGSWFQFGGDIRSGPARLAPLRARGMEFDEVRAWQPGDDPRHMHWKATARTGRPYTKLYHEESERPTVVCADLGARMHFATVGVFKSVLAARVAMMIAWAAVAARDRVSGLVLSPAGIDITPPLPGRRGAQRLARALAGAFLSAGGAGDRAELIDAVPALQRHAPSGSRLVLVGDFMGAGCIDAARRLAAHRPLLIVRLYDPLDRDLPPPGRYAVRDGRGEAVFHTGEDAARRRWQDVFVRGSRELAEIARTHGGAYVQFRTDEDPAGRRFAPPPGVRRPRASARRAPR